MDVALAPELERFVQEQVRSGAYPTANAVISRALALLREQTEDLEDLRREAMVGVEQADRGEFVEFTAKDIQTEGRRVLAARHARKSKRPARQA